MRDCDDPISAIDRHVFVHLRVKARDGGHLDREIVACRAAVIITTAVIAGHYGVILLNAERR